MDTGSGTLFFFNGDINNTDNLMYCQSSMLLTWQNKHVDTKLKQNGTIG